MAAKLPEGVKRKDMHIVEPKIVVVKEGWNPRKFANRTPEEIQNDADFKQFVINNGPKFPPIFVSSNGDVVELVDGERRLRATLGAVEAGAVIEGIPAIFLPANTSDIEKLGLSLSANQGEQLKPLEEAEACKRMKDWGADDDTIARIIGKSPSHVRNRLVLVQASPAVKDAVEKGTITQGEAMDTVKESGGDINKQDEKLKRMRKPDAQRAAKMMSRRKLEKALEALVSKAGDMGLDFENADAKSKVIGIMIGIKMVHGNLELSEAESEIFIAVQDAIAAAGKVEEQSADSAPATEPPAATAATAATEDDGAAPWEN